MSSQMIIRLDPDIKEKASKLAKLEGKNMSMLVREFLENYIKERDISGYIDTLWDRIGTQIEENGIKEEDIPDIINSVRNKND